MTASHRGRLLVATPKLLDPNFDRTVIYVCFHDEHGAFGLVLNRPIEQLDVAEHLPGWVGRLSEPRRMFIGGPVERTSALGLARGATDDLGDHWTRVGPDLGLVNLGRAAEDTPGIRDLRVFLGYAGWGEGQLDGEIEEGAWVVVDVRPGDLFAEAPEGLWREVLRRQKGDMALLASTPREPRVN